MNCTGFNLNILFSGPEFSSHQISQADISQRKIQRFSRTIRLSGLCFSLRLPWKKKKHRDVIVKMRDFFTNRHRRNVWKALAMLWNSVWNFFMMPWQSKFSISFKSVCVNWAIISHKHVTSSQLNEMFSLYISAWFCAWFYQAAHVLFC